MLVARHDDDDDDMTEKKNNLPIEICEQNKNICISFLRRRMNLSKKPKNQKTKTKQ